MEELRNLEQIDTLLSSFVRRLSRRGHGPVHGAVEGALNRFVVRSLVSEANGLIRELCRSTSEEERDRLLYRIQLRYPLLHHLRMLLHSAREENGAAGAEGVHDAGQTAPAYSPESHIMA